MKLSNKVKELQSILDKVDIDDFYVCNINESTIVLQGSLKNGLIEKYSKIFNREFKEWSRKFRFTSLEIKGVEITFEIND